MPQATPVRVGQYSLALGQMNANVSNPVSLDGLPASLNPGFKGLITALVISVSGNILTNASDPAIPGYMLYRLIDTVLTAFENLAISTRRGYAHAIFHHLKYHRFTGQVPADIPATGGAAGSYARTWTIRISLEEPDLPGMLRYARCLPPGVFRGAGLTLTPYTTAQSVNGANPRLDPANTTITVDAEMVDFPQNNVPVAWIAVEGNTPGRTFPRPSPGAGHYWRLVLANDPNTGGGFMDDVGGITKFSFGREPSMLFRGTNVLQYVRDWNDRFQADPKFIPTAAGTNVVFPEIVRFNDPLFLGHSSRLHYLPIIMPRSTDDPLKMPNFRDAPELVANDDAVAGLPTTVEYLHERIVDRTPRMTAMIQDALRARNVRFASSGASRMPGVASV